jgi:hypothetical protein
VVEAVNLAWRTARGDFREEGYPGLSALALALAAVGGGAALLAAVAVFLALEPIQ